MPRVKAAFVSQYRVADWKPHNRPQVADRGWKRPFDDPIPLPRGRQLVTLQDAGNYITKLPKAEHEAAEWQAAMEALILVVTLARGTDYICAHRHHEGIEPKRSAGV